MKPLETTTIGSFPFEAGERGLRLAVRIQVEAGIDYPCVPQLEDFCLLFLRELEGVEIRSNEAWLQGVPALRSVDRLLEDVNVAADEAERLGHDRGLKAQVTGPLTLCSVLKVSETETALQYHELIPEMASIVAELAKAIASHDAVKVLFIDEPVFPHALWSGVPEDLVLEAVNKVVDAAKVVGVAVGIHVCGEVVGYADHLLRTRADILHHEFKGTPRNFEAYSPEALKASGKLLGIGCVYNRAVGKEIPVETEDEILELLRKAAARYGPRIIVAPDCGFGGLRGLRPEEELAKILEIKLRRMVSAARRLASELGC